jgi:hypothetical protein
VAPKLHGSKHTIASGLVHGLLFPVCTQACVHMFVLLLLLQLNACKSGWCWPLLL